MSSRSVGGGNLVGLSFQEGCSNLLFTIIHKYSHFTTMMSRKESRHVQKYHTRGGWANTRVEQEVICCCSPSTSVFDVLRCFCKGYVKL